MSVLINGDTRLLVQGITGHQGAFHTRKMVEYGTRVVAGVTPGKGGQSVEGVPVFDTVRQAVAATGANTSAIFVPAPHATEAILEAAEAGIQTIVCITEGIPSLDMIRVVHYLRGKDVHLIGPNSPGIITPGQAKVGIMPGDIHVSGKVGVVSRSGTLTYEVVSTLTARGLGQSTCVGIGGDPVVGTTFCEVLRLFEADPDTVCVVLIGEIGGSEEEQAAEFVAHEMTKPVVAFVAGKTAPPETRMGHAGAIVSRGMGAAAEKIVALRRAGARIAERLEDIPRMLSEA